MDIELAYNILDILQTMWEAANLMRESYVSGDLNMVRRLSTDLQNGFSAIQKTMQNSDFTNKGIRLADACTCGIESLKDIMFFIAKVPEKVVWKLEYELAPIIETAAMQFYYWGIVMGHPEKRCEFLNFISNTDVFSCLKIPVQEREYSVDLTIVVTAYNKFDYTLACVKSVQENLPKSVKSEIILFNHGSTDCTKEYFENDKELKCVNVAVNGALPGVITKALFRGKYQLAVSNDVVIGPNAIDNLFRCGSEHPDYGYIVPTTPAVSNFQTITDISYNSLEQFRQAALKNNVYDETRHEQRVRLCNPIHFIPNEISAQMALDMYEDKLCNVSKAAYPDDKNSLWMRRNGYKCILAKDAYCHHFGSLTLKDEMGNQQKQQQLYLEGRKLFFQQYGIDPWGTGFCYEPQLFRKWRFPIIDNAAILGINCGIGSNSLKVKEILKERGGRSAVLYNGTQEANYLQDLKGVSDYAFVFSRLKDVIAETGRSFFHYIIVEDNVQQETNNSLLQEIQDSGLSFAELAYKVSNSEWNIIKGTIQ